MGSPQRTLQTKSPVVGDKGGNKDKRISPGVGRAPSPLSKKGDSPVMFDDSITLTVYEPTQQRSLQMYSPTNVSSPSAAADDEEKGRQDEGLELYQPTVTVKSLGGSSISPVRPGSAAIGTTAGAGAGVIGPAVGEGDSKQLRSGPPEVITTAKLLNSPTAFRPVSEELKLAATAQEDRERLVLEKGAPSNTASAKEGERVPSVSDNHSGELPKLWKGSLKAADYALYTEKAKKSKEDHKQSLRMRRKVMRRNRAINSHIRNAERRVKHCTQVSARCAHAPGSQATKWTRLAKTSYFRL